MTDDVTNRRRFLGSAAAAAVGAVAATTLEAQPAAHARPAAAQRGEAGVLVRGGDGGLYFIPDSKLAAFKIAANERPKLEAALPRVEAGDLPRETAAICSTTMRNVSRVTFVDVASIRRRSQ